MVEFIAGNKVNLRKLRRGDAAGLARHVNDITVARNTFIPHPYQIKDAHEFIRRAQREWREGTGYHFGIEDPSSGEIVGCIGFEAIQRKNRNCEAGYWLSRKYRGRGIMAEALPTAVDTVFRELKLKRVHAHVIVGNTASIRLLERCGFTQEGRLRKRIKHRGRYKDLLVFSILCEEWKAGHRQSN